MFSLWLSSAYTESRPFLPLTPPHQRVGSGSTRSWERTQLGQLTPTDQRDIPYHMTSCSVYKLQGAGRGAVIAAWELAGYQSVGGKQLHCASLALYVIITIIIILLLLLLLFYFILFQLLNCSYLNPGVFSLLLFWFSPPSHQGQGSEQVAAWCLVAGWGLTMTSTTLPSLP